MKWFRFYSEALDDPKVQKLRPELFKFWVNLLCLANAGSPRGTLPPIDDMALRMRIRRDHLERFIAALEASKLLVRDGSNALKPHNWDARQPASDNINSRVKRHRENRYKKREEANVTLHARSKSVTNAGADSDSEEDKNNINSRLTCAREESLPPSPPEVRPPVLAPTLQPPPSPRAPTPPAPTGQDTFEGMLAYLRAIDDVDPGTHSLTQAQAEATLRLVWEAFPENRRALCSGYWKGQHRHSDVAWRSAIKAAARSSKTVYSIAFVETIAARNPDGEPERPPLSGPGRPPGGDSEVRPRGKVFRLTPEEREQERIRIAHEKAKRLEREQKGGPPVARIPFPSVTARIRNRGSQ
jgi:hypothetical protein